MVGFYGTIGHNPRTNQLDSGANLDLDPGIFEGILPLQYIGNGKVSSQVWQQSNNTQASGSQTEQIKG